VSDTRHVEGTVVTLSFSRPTEYRMILTSFDLGGTLIPVP
jgi:hypothetical protein